MKFTGLFKKENNQPEVSVADVKESLNKLWLMGHNDVLTAEKAREISNDKCSYAYLDRKVISEIFRSVKEAAERHQWNASGSIGGISLSRDEIDYCVRYLNRAGYQEVFIQNKSDPNVFPKSVEYRVSW